MPKPKTHRARRNQREGARSHFRHWEPGRRPLVPIAWLSPLHSRPTQAHRAAPAAELRICRGDVDSTYPPREPASGLRRRGLSAPSSRFFDGSAKKVPQTLSARLSRANVCTGRMDLVWWTSPIFDSGKLRSTPLLSHSGHTEMVGSAARMPTSGYSVIVAAPRLTAQVSAFTIAVWCESTDSMLKMRPASRPADGIPLSA